MNRLLAIVTSLVLALACLGSGGCLQTIAEALLAPEAIALQGASGGLQALTSGVASQDVASLTDLSSTASELDRIVAEHPDAANRPELEALRDRLNATKQGKQAAAPRQGSIADELERRADFDRRVVVPDEKAKVGSDNLMLGPVASRARRPDGKPIPFPEPTPLDFWSPRLHVVDFTPVRVH